MKKDKTTPVRLGLEVVARLRRRAKQEGRTIRKEAEMLIDQGMVAKPGGK